MRDRHLRDAQRAHTDANHAEDATALIKLCARLLFSENSVPRLENGPDQRVESAALMILDDLCQRAILLGRFELVDCLSALGASLRAGARGHTITAQLEAIASLARLIDGDTLPAASLRTRERASPDVTSSTRAARSAPSSARRCLLTGSFKKGRRTRLAMTKKHLIPRRVARWRRAPLRPTTRSVAVVVAPLGGIGSLVELVRRVSSRDLSLIIVAHLSAPVSEGLAAALAVLRGRAVTVCRGSTTIHAGRCYLLPATDTVWSLTSAERSISIKGSPRAARTHVRPIDDFLRSCAGALGRRAIGCLLGGIDTDGADGLAAMRQARGTTYVEGETSAPRRASTEHAMKLDAADGVLSLGEIARMLDVISAQRRRGVGGERERRPRPTNRLYLRRT